MAIKGRSRKELFQLADDLDVKNYPCPAGGCLLTELSFVPKMRDIFDHSDDLNLRDFRMLKIGRHFRIGPRTKVIIGRDENDNRLLEAAIQPGETALFWLDGNTPAGVVMGAQDDTCLDLASRILLRYTKAEPGAACRLSVRCNDIEQTVSVLNDMNEAAVERYLIF
jgi:tRNA-uridine 2-sulfurtransferase